MKVRLNKNFRPHAKYPQILEEFGFKRVCFARETYCYYEIEYDVEDDCFNVFGTIGAIKLHFLLNKRLAIIEKKEK